MEYHDRHTKITFTIGPSTEPEAVLAQLLQANVDICRLNMAHATHDWTRATVKRIREVEASTGRSIAIMMDVKGPEIRTGVIEGIWELKAGDRLDLYIDLQAYTKHTAHHKAIDVNYPGLLADIHIGGTILVDNGLIRLKTIAKTAQYIETSVVVPGPLKSKRHINLPGVHVHLPAVTEKDFGDIDVAIEMGIEFIALSFVRAAEDVVMLRNYLKSKNAHGIRIISKLEDQSAIDNLDAIIEVSDAIIVARGDLGIECPFEQIPTLQDRIVKACSNHGRPVIVATHMLESMIEAPIPTRAEVSDVALAVSQKADGIMLSGETAVGKHPVACVETMQKIAVQAESALAKTYNESFALRLPKNKMLRSAVVLAQELENAGILMFTRSGNSAQMISSLRPTRCPVYAFSDNPTIAKHMRILWGINPFYMPFEDNKDQTIQNAIKRLLEQRSIQKGDYLIILTNIEVLGKNVDTIQMRRI